MTTIYCQGHGSLRISTANGTTVYVDPFAGEGYDIPADIILVTHQHQDHNCIDLIKNRNEDCVVLQNFDMLVDGKYLEKTVKDVKIEAVEAYNKNHPKSECVGYVLTIEGKQIYIAGDTSETAQMKKLGKRGLDAAFLPCDGVYNMGIDEAEKCAKILKAKICVPYHVAPGKLFDEEKAAQFNVKGAFIVRPGEKLELK